MTVATIDPRTRATTLEAVIAELERQRRAAMDDLIDDLKFQDIPVVEFVAPITVTRVHLTEMSYEDKDEKRGGYHLADDCHRCNPRLPSRRNKYGRKGKGVWQTYLGTWEAVGKKAVYTNEFPEDEDMALMVFIPEGALQAPRHLNN